MVGVYGSNTDGMVVGALPEGFTILGQFTPPPPEWADPDENISSWKNLGGGWVVISAEGMRIPLSLVVGQRVRLDVPLQVKVRQDH